MDTITESSVGILGNPSVLAWGTHFKRCPHTWGIPNSSVQDSWAAVGLCPAILFILWDACLTPCVLCFWYPQWSSGLSLCGCHGESVSRATALPWDAGLWLWASGKGVPEDWSDQVSSDSYVKPAAGRQGGRPGAELLDSCGPSPPSHSNMSCLTKFFLS